MNNVKVSVIVPVYNTEKYLRQCLDSILAQTLRDIEIICVNDGSTDSSPEILEEYRRLDSRIKIIHLPKCSIGTARNHGINVATGVYLSFVDSDDFIREDMLQTLYNKACFYSAQIAITNINLFYNESKTMSLYRDSILYSRLQRLGSFSINECPEILQSVGIWDKIYLRDFIERHKLRNPENIVFEDHLFSFQALILASKITVIDLPLYYYRKNLYKSITGQEVQNDLYKMDFLTISNSIRTFLKSEHVYDIFIKEFVKYLFSNSLWHQSNIVSYLHFKDYFYQFKRNISDEEFALVLENAKLKTKLYSLALLHNQCLGFYFLCRAKKMFNIKR